SLALAFYGWHLSFPPRTIRACLWLFQNAAGAKRVSGDIARADCGCQYVWRLCTSVVSASRLFIDGGWRLLSAADEPTFVHCLVKRSSTPAGTLPPASLVLTHTYNALLCSVGHSSCLLCSPIRPVCIERLCHISYLVYCYN
ncbi:hypothetical protein OBBRIDRAFT_781518, partial [Obba rivulosa]